MGITFAFELQPEQIGGSGATQVGETLLVSVATMSVRWLHPMVLITNRKSQTEIPGNLILSPFMAPSVPFFFIETKSGFLQ